MTIKLPRAVCVCLTLMTVVVCADAQTSGQGRAQAPAQAQGATAETRTNADEDFELNISERRITEENFEASTQVEVGGENARGLNLRVGVAVGAASIDVLLRNVQGRVRFRATLEPLLRRFNLNLRRAEETATPSP